MNDKLRVLLVEDNPGDADLIREMLPSGEDEGFTIHCVQRLSEAVSFLGKGEADLTLLDLGLPDSDGIDTIRVVRKAAPNVPVVVLTGNDDEKIGIAAVRDGAQDYLLKGQTPGYHLSRVLRYAVQRQNAEDKLRESERVLRSTLNALSTHIAIVDAQGAIIKTNTAWQDDINGHEATTEDQYQSTPYLRGNALNEEDAEYEKRFAQGVRSVLSGEKEYFEMEYSCQYPHQKRWFIGRVTPFPGAGPSWAVVAREDITAIKEAEAEKGRLAEQLRLKQKMEALGTLAGGIAHDFNNILSAVLGYTELCISDVPKGSHLEANLQEVYQAGYRAKELVNQIVTFARKDDAEMKPTHIGNIAREVLKLIRSAIPASIEITHTIDTDACAMAIPTQIHQMFMNLCTNAAHAMRSAAGKLHVYLSEQALDNKTIPKASDLKPGRYVKIEVADTGVGIAPDQLDLIFDPYYSTREGGEGTGLGLAIVHSIVKRCGGHIFVRSTLGRGTTATVYLPATTKPAKKTQTFNDHLPRGNERILFVDDERPITKMGQQSLGRLGYTVTAVNCSIEALELFKKNPAAFDIVISDITMPKMNGDRLAQEITSRVPGLPVILCTGYSRKPDKKSLEQLGVKAYLKKPIAIKLLAETVRSVLDDRKIQITESL